MHLHRLRLVNFRLHADTEILLGPGITAIVGPNGAGKTTLLEALAWAFYGNPAARGARDSIRRIDAPSGEPVRVEVEFGLGAHEYRVVRKVSGAELYQDGGEGPIANSHRMVTAKLMRVLGMTRDEFFNTYFTGQKELAVMAAMGATERAKFLSKLLGYERLRIAQDHLRSRRSTIRAEMTGLEQGLENERVLREDRDETRARRNDTLARLKALTEERKNAEEKLAGLRPQWEKMQALRESTVSLQSELGMAKQHVEEARRDLLRLDKELAETLRAKDRLQELEPQLARVEAVRTEFDVLEQASRSAGRRRVLTGQLEEVEGQLERLHERLRQMATAESTMDRARSALVRAQTALHKLEESSDTARTSWVRDRQDAETRHRSLQEQYRTLKDDRDRIVEAGPEGACPTCSRSLGSEFDSVLDTISRQLEEIEANGKYLKQRVQQLKAEPDALTHLEEKSQHQVKLVEKAVQAVADTEAQLRLRREAEEEHRRLGTRRAEIEKELSSLQDNYDPDRHDTLRNELRNLEDSVKLAAQLGVRAERADQLVAEAEAAERTLSQKEANVKALATSIADTGYSEEQYVDIKKAHEAAETRASRAVLQETAVQGDLKAVETALNSVERRLEERAARAQRITVLKSDAMLHDELDAAFEELRRELNARLRPDLSDIASAFLAELTDGRYQELELDEQYRLTVVEDSLPKPVISGGEEDVANLVVRLAISQMVSERAGQPLSLLVLDEIFGGLDEDRRHNVVGLLRGLADRFPQVVLITHIESVKDGVDRILRVNLDAKQRVATVTEEESLVTEEDAAA